MHNQDRSHWVTHEQLDTPLCDIFDGTKTTRTARQYIQNACFILRQQPLNLSKLSYEELNLYMDLLDATIVQSFGK